MAINVTFSGEPTRKDAARALQNVSALLLELPLSQVVLLDWLGAEIDLRSDAVGPRSLPRPRMIALEIEALGSFGHRPSGRASRGQFSALRSLERQAIEMLDAEFRYTSRRVWKMAARAELGDASLPMSLAVPTPPIDDVTARHHVCQGWMRRLSSKVSALLAGSAKPERRLLAQILLRREDLKTRREKQLSVDRQMSSEFPRTYRLALEFEALLEDRAKGIAIARHPELATHATDAMRAVRRELRVTHPPGLAPRQPGEELPSGPHRF